MSERPEIPAILTHREYFESLFMDRVNKSTLPKIDTLNAVIQFRITDDDDDGIWNVVIEKGLVREVTKRTIDNPTCAFLLDSATFLSIVKREITPQQAFFQGKADIKGDILLALKMNILVGYM